MILNHLALKNDIESFSTQKNDIESFSTQKMILNHLALKE
jgi:hypothetical protein